MYSLHEYWIIVINILFNFIKGHKIFRGVGIYIPGDGGKGGSFLEFREVQKGVVSEHRTQC